MSTPAFFRRIPSTGATSAPPTTAQTQFLGTSMLPPRRVVRVGKSTVMAEYASFALSLAQPNQFVLGVNARNLLAEGTATDD